jgi:hypothetical protein
MNWRSTSRDHFAGVGDLLEQLLHVDNCLAGLL